MLSNSVIGGGGVNPGLRSVTESAEKKPGIKDVMLPIVSGQCIGYIKKRFSEAEFISKESIDWLLALLKLDVDKDNRQFQIDYNKVAHLYPQYCDITQYDASSLGFKILHKIIANEITDLTRVKSIIRVIQEGVIVNAAGEVESLFASNRRGQQEICYEIYEERLKLYRKNYLSVADDNDKYIKDKLIFDKLTRFISNLGYQLSIPGPEIIIRFKDTDPELWQYYLNHNPEAAILEMKPSQLDYSLAAPNINGHECHLVIRIVCDDLNITANTPVFIEDQAYTTDNLVLNPKIGVGVKKYFARREESRRIEAKILIKQAKLNARLQDAHKAGNIVDYIELINFVRNFNLEFQELGDDYPRLLFSVQGLKLVLAESNIRANAS